MFVDEAEIILKGGRGGAGIGSFGKRMGSGPNGGNGGSGGNVHLVTDADLTLLNQFTAKSLFEAGDGHLGGRNRKTGKNGENLEIKVPIGTSVIDKKSLETLFEMKKVGQWELICVGGKGGRGNYEFKSPRRTAPEFAQPGLPGEIRELILILKLIADFGLIGLPNAGKSSLLNELTNARAKVADYAFTTLYPNLGVFKGKVIADIPGLIEGASFGRGLGISFLKHIEKVGTLLHCISSESKNPTKDYETFAKEMKSFNEKLTKKPEIILITKSDLTDAKALSIMKRKLKKYAPRIITVSIHDWDSIEELKNLISDKT